VNGTPSLTLTPPRASLARISTSICRATQGLKRQDQERTGGRLMYLDATAVYARCRRTQCAHCRNRTPIRTCPAALPPREQKLLLMPTRRVVRPDALAFSAPRAAPIDRRRDAGGFVGLQAFDARRRRSGAPVPAEAKSSGAMHSYDEITQLVNPNVNRSRSRDGSAARRGRWSTAAKAAAA